MLNICVVLIRAKH